MTKHLHKQWILGYWVWRLNGHFTGGVDGVFGSYVTITACHLEQAAAACVMSTLSPLIVIVHVSYSCHVFRVRLLLHLLYRAHPVLGTYMYGCLSPSVISAYTCLWYLTAGNIWQGIKIGGLAILWACQQVNYYTELSVCGCGFIQHEPMIIHSPPQQSR